MSHAEPDVFAYEDYRAYLRDAYRTARDRRGFSHRALARRARIASSSFLLRVMDGDRNLAPPTAERVARAVGLSGDAADFFLALVRFNQARSSRERAEAYARLHRFARYRRVRPLEAARDEYHAHWFLPAIRELAASPRFRADPEWIARRLRPTVKPSEARRALATLERLGLLVRTDDGELQQASTLVSSGREAHSVHMARFHRSMMERASASIDEVPSADRDISSITVCVGPTGLPRLKQRVQEMRRALLDENGAASDGVQVVQLNIQLFPLSDRLDREEA